MSRRFMPDPGSLLPCHLGVSDLEEPVGTSARPYFGWHLRATRPAQRQSAYQLLVASSVASLAAGVGDVWDSGPVASDTQNHVVYGGPALHSDTRYRWTVRVWDGDGQSGPYAAPASFVVGLLTNKAWAGAAWLRRATDEPDEYSYFRRRITLPAGTLTEARLYITAAHQYQLALNGRLIGRGPSYHYPQFQYYNAFDVTETLVAGTENVLAIFLRWFGPGQGRPASARGLLLKALLRYADGTIVTVTSDAAWRCRRATAWRTGQPPRHPHEGVGYVETIDAAHLLDWQAPGLDDADWESVVVLGPHPAAPWLDPLRPDLSRIVERAVPPATITAHGNGCYVIDLGRVYAGRPQLHLAGGTPETPLCVEGGYTLTEEGTIDRNTQQETDMRFFAIPNGAPFTFLPQEYLGMRYLQIDGALHPVTGENVSFLARHASLDDRHATFASSDPTLNQVWELMKHSLTLGAQEQFLDTPTREKGGFLLDSMNQSLAAMALFGERVLTRKCLHEFLDSMAQFWSAEADRGRMNAVYPNGDGARDIPDFTQSYPLWVWEYFLHTGDRAFLRHAYPSLQAIAGYVARHRDPTTGLIHTLTGGAGPYEHGIVDWPPTMRYGYDMETSARTVINALAFADFDLLARIAAELGRTADAQHYRAQADALRAAINHHLLPESGGYVDGLHADGRRSSHRSQQASALPLALGLVPADRRAAVLAFVKEMGMRCGMVTVYWLVRALGEMGEGGALLDLYTCAEGGGWANTLAQGGTCTWESWDAVSGGVLSQSHPWGAVGLVGIHQYILGVQSLAPQAARLRIRPLCFGNRLAHARGTLPTERGPVRVAWVHEGNRFTLAVTLPPNVQAQLCLPISAGTRPRLTLNGASATGRQDGRYLIVENVGSGSHEIVVAP